MSSGLGVEGTSSNLVQTTGESASLIATQPVEAPGTRGFEAASNSATCLVEGPSTRVLATQPVEAPVAGRATQPVEASGAGPGVLLTGNGSDVQLDQSAHITGEPESEADLDSEPGPPADDNLQGELPDDTVNQGLSEEASYRETIRRDRSFMGWHQIPTDASSSLDDNLFAGSRVKPTRKVSVKLPVEEWLCRKFEKLNLTVSEGYPSRNTLETGGLLRDQFVKIPRPSRWYEMYR